MTIRRCRRICASRKGATVKLGRHEIGEFRSTSGLSIPTHLLHIADSVRLIGNVPGAHTTEIADYQFSRSDAGFAPYATRHDLDLYFSPRMPPNITL
jgi:hypothetical protein